jgi:hypothetical protein
VGGPDDKNMQVISQYYFDALKSLKPVVPVLYILVGSSNIAGLCLNGCQ